MRQGTFESLHDELMSAFAGGATTPWSEDRFEELALRVFAWQFGSNPVYRRFAEARGATPATVASWTDVPAVPADAFKHLELVSGGPGAVQRVFRTSGTTLAGRPGEHHVRSLALYRASLLPTFAARVLPDGARLAFLSLIPSPGRAPHSSLSTMVEAAADAFGAPGGGWFAEAPEGLDVEGFSAALLQAELTDTAVLVLGTAFALVHWLDALEAGAGGVSGARFSLPAGSRVMETGGFKGRTRSLERSELYSALGDRLGLGAEWIVSEYGMTELLSQYYEAGMGDATVLGHGVSPALEERRLVAPPWLRCQVLDPISLAPLPAGKPGLLQHFDLANLGSVCAVLTADVGRQDEGGIRLAGRAPGAEPRGCSLAMEELLSAVEGGRS